MSETTPALREVHRVSEQISEKKRAFFEAELQHQKEMRELRSKLDSAMVAAVDWGKETATAVSKAAGYASHNAVGDARKRIDARNIEVR